MKVLVYTCNVNNYDRRKPYYDNDKDTQYLYYTDNMSPLDGWQLQPIDKSISDNPTNIARYYKVNSHLLPNHEYSVWIDSSFQLKPVNMMEYIKKYLRRYDMATYFHSDNDPDRCCIYKEAAVCMINGKGDCETLLDQVVSYRNEGYPIKNDLRSTGIIIRRNNGKVKEFNEIWWKEILKHSNRDQISHMYAVWKSKIRSAKILVDNVYNNELVKHFNHIHVEEELRNKIIKKRIRKRTLTNQ